MMGFALFLGIGIGFIIGYLCEMWNYDYSILVKSLYFIFVSGLYLGIGVSEMLNISSFSLENILIGKSKLVFLTMLSLWPFTLFICWILDTYKRFKTKYNLR